MYLYASLAAAIHDVCFLGLAICDELEYGVGLKHQRHVP
jgi:hypothetical protein